MQSSQGMRCRDLKADRNIGSYWQDRLVQMAVDYGCVAEDKQKGKSNSAVAMSPHGGLILPDLQLSKDGVTIVPEVKHKDPTRHGQYGYEEYRLRDLIDYATATGLPTIIAIHDHSLAGGRNVLANHIRHWRWQDVLALDVSFDYRAPGTTYFNGEPVVRPIRYWDVSRFMPLTDHPFFASKRETLYRLDSSRAAVQKMLFARKEIARDGR